MNDQQDHGKLARIVAENFRNDPRGYCEAVLRYTPDEWQVRVMESVRDNPLTAVRSGNGPGKTRMAASVIHWFIATRSCPAIDATAGRFTQLKERLWRELAKVNDQAINKDLFEWTQTSFYLKDKPELWKANAVPWSKHNPEAFAGMHEKNVLRVFDEASAIDDVIWETALGSMTTEGARWLSVGNPTRSRGKFAECFGKGAWREGMNSRFGWHGHTVGSRDSARYLAAGGEMFIQQVIQEYGAESDYYRVHVLGLPPRQEDLQFIGDDLFESAVGRVNVENPLAPRILAVDVAWTGGDRTVLIERKGLMIKKLLIRHGQDTMKTVGDIIAAINRSREEGDPYDYVVVDVVGIGAGVFDRLREQNYNPIGVNSGTSPKDPLKYKNLRAEMWDAYKNWLREGTIERDFFEDSCGIQYNYDSASRLQMERKIDMKARGLHSPDLADAAVLSFYVTNAARPQMPQHVVARRQAGSGWRR